MTNLSTADELRSTESADVERREEPADTGTITRVVVDTSVLIADPHCVQSFGAVALIIPLTVVEELDSLKTRPDDVGRSGAHRTAGDRGAACAARRVARRTGSGR